jgi:hypothetical protein
MRENDSEWCGQIWGRNEKAQHSWRGTMSAYNNVSANWGRIWGAELDLADRK